jgi:hypothetical protein
MKMKTHIRAGCLSDNHNEAMARDKATARGLKVKTHVKAGRGAIGY